MGFGFSTQEDRGTGQGGEDIHIEDKEEGGDFGVGHDPFVAEFCAIEDDDGAKDHYSWNEHDRSPAEGHVKSLAVHADQSGLQKVEQEEGDHDNSMNVDEIGERWTGDERYYVFQRLLEVGGEEADEDGGDNDDRHGEEEAMISALTGLDGAPELLAFEDRAGSINAPVF